MATKSPPTFVVGVPRSGTTLLRVLLDSHSNIASGPEAGWITGDYTETSIKRLTELLGDGELGLVQNFPGTSQKQVLRATARLLQDLFTPYLGERNKKVLVLKTPNDIAHVGYLRKLMPNSNFIHILRDGRDVALSTVAKKGTFFSDTTLGYEFGNLTFANALRRWMVWEQRASKVLKRIPKRVHSVRYEDLVASPESELRDLCTFLGQEFEPSMLAYATHSHEYPEWEAGSTDVKNKELIVNESVARWKRELTALDAAAISTTLNNYLVNNGYEDTFENFNPELIEIARAEQQQAAHSQEEHRKQLEEVSSQLADANSILEQERIQNLGGGSNELTASIAQLNEQYKRLAVVLEQQRSDSIEDIFTQALTISQSDILSSINNLTTRQSELGNTLNANHSKFSSALDSSRQVLTDFISQSQHDHLEKLRELQNQLLAQTQRSTTLESELNTVSREKHKLLNDLTIEVTREQDRASQLQAQLEANKAEAESNSKLALKNDKEQVARYQALLEEKAAEYKTLQETSTAKDRAIRQLAESRKRQTALTDHITKLKRDSEQMKLSNLELQAEITRAKTRLAQTSSSSQSLQRIIAQQERETWEKEQVIQGMLNSRTWKAGRLALGPAAFARNAFRKKSSATTDPSPNAPLTSAELRRQAEVDAYEAEQAFRANEARAVKEAAEAQRAASAQSAARAAAAKEFDSVQAQKEVSLASQARAATEAAKAGEALKAQQAGEAQQATQARHAQEALSVTESLEFSRQQAFSGNQVRAVKDASAPAISTQKPNAAKNGKVNLGAQVEEYFGAHRSGWAFAVQHLSDLQDTQAIHLDTFMERTFCWEGGRGAILEPWLGIIHVPPSGPDWFLGSQSNQSLFSSDYWKASEPYCQGLYCLSNYHRRELRKLVDLPIETLIHPTETPEVLWDPERFTSSKKPKVVQLGWWLRVLHAIYELPDTSYEKVFLRPRNDQAFLDALATERELHLKTGQFTEAMQRTVTEYDFLENDDYDKLLSESVVFMQLYDASANNAVIECIVRNTPLLISPLDPVVEYLGGGYPLYFETLEEAAEKLENKALILHAHEYLKSHPIKEKLTGEYFMRSLQESPMLRRQSL